jgi:hypothetical protein
VWLEIKHIQHYLAYGLRRRNQRSQMLIDFCERNRLIITNTWFKKPKTRLHTWKAPGDGSRHKLDYTLVKGGSGTVWRMCRHCLEQILTLTTNYWLHRSAPDWRQSYDSKSENQDEMWRSYMCNDRKFKIV